MTPHFNGWTLPLTKSLALLFYIIVSLPMAGGGELRCLPLSKSKRFSRSKVESKHIPDGESFRSRGSEHSSLLEEFSAKECREGTHKGRLLHFSYPGKNYIKQLLN
jgi:hypothetical protein